MCKRNLAVAQHDVCVNVQEKLAVASHDVCVVVQENLAVAKNVNIPPTPPTRFTITMTRRTHKTEKMETAHGPLTASTPKTRYNHIYIYNTMYNRKNSEWNKHTHIMSSSFKAYLFHLAFPAAPPSPKGQDLRRRQRLLPTRPP